MRYNKTLGVAIAAILSGGIGLAANAGELSFETGLVATTNTADVVGVKTDTNPFLQDINVGNDTVKEIAAEGIDDDGSMTVGLDPVTTWFELSRDANIIFDIYVNYTLTGAQFSVATNAPELVSGDQNTSHAEITRISGGQIGDSTVRYLIQATDSDVRIDDDIEASTAQSKEDRIRFSFTANNAIGLINSGGTIKLNSNWGAAAVVFSPEENDTITAFKSISGVTVDFIAVPIPAEIDVTAGSKQFVNGITTTAITLGTIEINNTLALPVIDIVTPNVKGSLIITGGPFAASGTDQVFLDIDGSDCVFSGEDGPDIAATLDNNEATFELKDSDVSNMVASAVNVCVIVDNDNDNEINATKDRATAALVLSYPSDKDITYVGRLAQIKRNGTACTLYNVPHKQASDKGFYRFINKVDNEVTVWGTIKDREGVEHLVDQELGTIPGNSTLVVNSDQLHDYAITAGSAEVKPWVGRAILTINSNSTDMEAYALLRGKNTKSVLLPAGATTAPANIGPLINVSLGASGNGCD